MPKAKSTADSSGASVSSGAAFILHANQAEPLQRAAELLAESAESILQDREYLRLAIPGGSAMQAALLLKSKLDARWSRVALTWVDERCVATDDPDSNYGAAIQAGLEKIPAAAKHLPLFQTGEAPRQAVDRVTDRLKSDFSSGLDLLLLGMGEDGHIASIFPDPQRHSFPTPSEPETTPSPGPFWVEHVSQSPKPPSNRITLTRTFLGSARRAVLVALGEGKRAALERLLAGDVRLPAVGLPDLQIVTDLAFPASSPFPASSS